MCNQMLFGREREEEEEERGKERKEEERKAALCSVFSGGGVLTDEVREKVRYCHVGQVHVGRGVHVLVAEDHETRGDVALKESKKKFLICAISPPLLDFFPHQHPNDEDARVDRRDWHYGCERGSPGSQVSPNVRLLVKVRRRRQHQVEVGRVGAGVVHAGPERDTNVWAAALTHKHEPQTLLYCVHEYVVKVRHIGKKSTERPQ